MQKWLRDLGIDTSYLPTLHLQGFVPSSILLTPALWYGWSCWSLFQLPDSWSESRVHPGQKRINNSTDSESHLETFKEFPPRLLHVCVVDFGRKPEKPQKRNMVITTVKPLGALGSNVQPSSYANHCTSVCLVFEVVE